MDVTVAAEQFHNQNESCGSDAAAGEFPLGTGPFFPHSCQMATDGAGHAACPAGSTGPSELKNMSMAHPAPAPGNPQVEKRVPMGESRNFQELLRASARTQDQLNHFLTSIDSLLVSVCPPKPPVSSRAKLTNMPAPIASVERSKRAPIDFGSEELRIALLAGGERAQHVKCPKCESDNVRRASPATPHESYMRLFFMSPYRCRKCLSRFSARNAAEPKLSRRFPRALQAQPGI